MSFTIFFSQMGVQKYKSSLDIQTIMANNCKNYVQIYFIFILRLMRGTAIYIILN